MSNKEARLLLLATPTFFKFSFFQCQAKTWGATRNPEFPRTGPDQNRSEVGNIFKNIFRPGRVRNFISDRSGLGYFLPGMRHFLLGFRG